MTNFGQRGGGAAAPGGRTQSSLFQFFNLNSSTFLNLHQMNTLNFIQKVGKRILDANVYVFDDICVMSFLDSELLRKVGKRILDANVCIFDDICVMSFLDSEFRRKVGKRILDANFCVFDDICVMSFFGF